MSNSGIIADKLEAYKEETGRSPIIIEMKDAIILEMTPENTNIIANTQSTFIKNIKCGVITFETMVEEKVTEDGKRNS